VYKVCLKGGIKKEKNRRQTTLEENLSVQNISNAEKWQRHIIVCLVTSLFHILVFRFVFTAHLCGIFESCLLIIKKYLAIYFSTEILLQQRNALIDEIQSLQVSNELQINGMIITHQMELHSVEHRMESAHKDGKYLRLMMESIYT